MKTFLVRIQIRSGEFEKHSRKLIENCEDEKEAGRRALEGECHSDIGPEETSAAWWTDEDLADELWDDSGGMVYTIESIHEVAPDDVKVLAHYFGLY